MGWLNVALLDKAHAYFEPTADLNGFDGWRRIVHQIHQGAEVRRGTLRRVTKNMPKIAKLEGIDTGILHFEAVVRDYGKAGGTVPTNDELNADLNDMLQNKPLSS